MGFQPIIVHSGTYLINSDKTWVFDQSEGMKRTIDIINYDKTLVFNQPERAQGPTFLLFVTF